MSALSLILKAQLSIKVVILALITCSIMSVTIIIYKFIRINKLNSDAGEFEADFWETKSLDRLYTQIKDSQHDPLGNMFCNVMHELHEIVENKVKTINIYKRIEKVSEIIIRKQEMELTENMGFLSAIGANGVIIGIFGTVIGIMNGFQVIASQKSANIAVIAPVISESLITTAIGLVAAIPAAISYNIIMSKISAYITRMENFKDELTSIIFSTQE